MSEPEIQDFLRKTASYLADMPVQERESALEALGSSLRAHRQALPQENFIRTKRLLGGPRGAANFLRLQKRLPLRGSRAQSTRQAMLMVFGSAAIVFLLLVFIFWWKFTPIYSNDNNRVQILGGLIDIDNQLGQVKVGDNYEFSDSQFKNVFEGSYEVPEEVEDVIVGFERGQMQITYTPDQRISWNCKVTDEPSDRFIKQDKEALEIDLRGPKGMDCIFKMPSKLKYTINGDAGKVDLVAPANDTFVQLGSGLVEVAPDSELSYRYDVKVGQGQVQGDFDMASKEGGIEIKVDVGTGNVQKK